MGGAIIGLGSSNSLNPAANAEYEGLYAALNGQFGPYFVINGYGEALGPSPARPWTLTGSGSVSQYIQKGGVFIDFCGWPMYASVSAGGMRSYNYAQGFQTFARAIGYTWLANEVFSPPRTTATTITPYPFIRGFNLQGSEAGVYLPQGLVYGRPVNANGAVAMVALHHAGIGWYFWAVNLTSLAASLSDLGAVSSIPVSVYANFITAVMKGQGSTANGITIKYAAYQGPTQTTSTQPIYPTSPYGGNSTSGSSTSGSSGGQSTTTTTTKSPTVTTATTCPSGYTLVNGQCVANPSPTWVKPAIGLGAAGLGAGIIYYAGKQEGWWGNHGQSE